MRALLITTAADAAARASGADAIVADTGEADDPALYLMLPPLEAARAREALSQAANLRPRGFALPLAEGGADVQRLGARLAVEEARLGLPEGAFRILAFATESPRAIFGLPSYVGASARLDALVFSAAPLAAHRLGAGPLRFARESLLIAARAAGVLALDAFDGDAARAAADGFDGMTGRSAAEIALIRAAFAPKA